MIPKFFLNLEIFATRPQSVQREEMCKILMSPWNVRIASFFTDDGNRPIYIEKDDEGVMLNSINQKISRQSSWDKIKKDYHPKVSELLKISKLIGEYKINFKNNKELIKKLSTHQRILKSLAIYFWAPWVVENILDEEFKVLLKQTFKSEEVDKIYNAVASPTKLNEYQKMRLTIDQIALKKKRDEKDYEGLTKKFDWYNEYCLLENLYDANFFRHEVKILSKEAASQESDFIKKELRKNKLQFKKCFKLLKNSRQKMLAEIINNFAFLRTDRIDQFKKSLVLLRPFYESIASEMSRVTGKYWDRSMVVHLLNNEILDFLKIGKIPSYEIIKKRASQNYIYYNDGLTGHVVADGDKVKAIKKIILNNDKMTEAIKGMTAVRGLIKGKVCKILSKKDLAKFKSGQILVARTTMPDYTPTMKMASAIITDEGGVTCHAAVISREFKIPCIVGTKISTKVLKDGDIVEVDAKRGVVRVLKEVK